MSNPVQYPALSAAYMILTLTSSKPVFGLEKTVCVVELGALHSRATGVVETQILVRVRGT